MNTEWAKLQYLNLEMVTHNNGDTRRIVNLVSDRLSQMGGNQVLSLEAAKQVYNTTLGAEIIENPSVKILVQKHRKQIDEMCIRNIRLGRDLFHLSKSAQEKYQTTFENLRNAYTGELPMITTINANLLL